MKLQSLDGYSFTIDDEDYFRVSQYNWSLTANKSALRTDIDGKTITLGRFLLNYQGPLDVDHEDRDVFNNIKKNLRILNHTLNCINQDLKFNNTSGYKGVSFHKRDKKWFAQLQRNGKRGFLGYFKTPEAAARAYDKAAFEHFGNIAFLNFPQEIK